MAYFLEAKMEEKRFADLLMLSFLEYKNLKCYLEAGCDYERTSRLLKSKVHRVFSHVFRASELIGIQTKDLPKHKDSLSLALLEVPEEWFHMKKKERKKILTMGSNSTLMKAWPASSPECAPQESSQPIPKRAVAVTLKKAPIVHKKLSKKEKLANLLSEIFHDNQHLKLQILSERLGHKCLGDLIDNGVLEIKTGGLALFQRDKASQLFGQISNNIEGIN